MANFERLFHWERFIPNLGNNRELVADQFTLDLACGLTKVDLQRIKDAPRKIADLVPDPVAEGATVDSIEATMRDKSAEVLAAELGAFVKLGPGNHSFNGEPIATLRDYFRFVLMQPGIFNFVELQTELSRLNSVQGTKELFYGASAGGSTSTRHVNGAPVANQTDAH